MMINFWHVLVCYTFLSEYQPEIGFLYLVFGCFTKKFSNFGITQTKIMDTLHMHVCIYLFRLIYSIHIV